MRFIVLALAALIFVGCETPGQKAERLSLQREIEFLNRKIHATVKASSSVERLDTLLSQMPLVNFDPGGDYQTLLQKAVAPKDEASFAWLPYNKVLYAIVEIEGSRSLWKYENDKWDELALISPLTPEEAEAFEKGNGFVPGTVGVAKLRKTEFDLYTP